MRHRVENIHNDKGTLVLLGVSVGFVAGWEEFDLSFLVCFCIIHFYLKLLFSFMFFFIVLAVVNEMSFWFISQSAYA